MKQVVCTFILLGLIHLSVCSVKESKLKEENQKIHSDDSNEKWIVIFEDDNDSDQYHEDIDQDIDDIQFDIDEELDEELDELEHEFLEEIDENQNYDDQNDLEDQEQIEIFDNIDYQDKFEGDFGDEYGELAEEDYSHYQKERSSDLFQPI